MTKIQDIRNQTPKRSTRSVSSIKRIARHHSATISGDFWAFWNGRWKGLGWNTGGYHEIILRDGTVQICYDANVITNGIANHNSDTYHICVVGNGSFTDEQEKVFEERVRLAMKRFNVSVSSVLGHKEFSGASTACPGIDMSTVRDILRKPVITNDKKESVRMWKPSSPSLRDSAIRAIEDLTDEEKYGKATALNKSWVEKAKQGTLPIDDAIAITLYVSRHKK